MSVSTGEVDNPASEEAVDGRDEPRSSREGTDKEDCLRPSAFFSGGSGGVVLLKEAHLDRREGGT